MGSQLLADVVEALLYVHRNRRFIRDGEPRTATIVQELCESLGGRPGLSVLTILLVSVDIKNY